MTSHQPEPIEGIIETLLEDEKGTEHPYPVLTQLTIAGLLILLMFAISYIVPDARITSRSAPSLSQTDTTPETNANAASIIDGVEGVPNKKSFEIPETLHARAMLVYDVRENAILFEKSASEPLPLASLTKLMTALLAYEIIPLSERFTVSNDALSVEGDSGMRMQESYKLDTLIDMSLMSSVNDASHLIAEVGGTYISNDTDPYNVFVASMNVRARDLGLQDTRFLNPTGLDMSETEAGSYGSARDMATLLTHMLKATPEVFAYTTRGSAIVTSEEGTRHDLTNTNYITDKIPGLRASKTGYTTLAGGNLVTVFDAGLRRPIVVVVLGSTFEGRFSDTQALVDATLTFLTK